MGVQRVSGVLVLVLPDDWESVQFRGHGTSSMLRAEVLVCKLDCEQTLNYYSAAARG